MELLCIGVVFLWGLVFAAIVASAAFAKGAQSRSNFENAKNVFPINSYDVFINAEKITLYSLNTGDLKFKQQFYGYDVSGIKELTIDEWKEVRENFLKTADIRSLSKHFEPHYGLRVERGNESLDMLVSFEYSTFIVHYKGKKRTGSFFEASEGLFREALEAVGG